MKNEVLEQDGAVVRARCTFELKILIIGMLILSWFGWLRLQQVIKYWDFLLLLCLQPSPLYLAVYGAVCGLIGMASAITLWLRWYWAPQLTYLTALIYVSWYWLDRLLLTRSVASQANYPFAVGVTILGLGCIFVILALPRQRWYFSTGIRFLTAKNKNVKSAG